ncbi:unnamed protein product [Protopolystoma xenopodis]|uniref:Protein CLP1 homolog n=1 Tax=Protopolystoma xenopodis TaxID=117903 RepID=A0A3S5B1Y7_9PLAT|nr:unnamed protein product [Protopolystoma xenopodis]
MDEDPNHLSSAKSETKDFALSQYQMLRYEVSSLSSIILTGGRAEIFGTELVIGCELPLHAGERGTVVTFHGCKISVKGRGIATFLTTASEDQEIVHVYMNIHANLEKSREQAIKEQSRGPRVLICGQESVGKSTLCRTLVNYAARRGHKPVLVDANVGLSQVSIIFNYHLKVCIPTTISALAVTKPYDLLDGWDLEEDPLVFSFGYVDPARNLNLFREQITQLAELVNIRSENDMVIFNSGCVINMCGIRKNDSDDGESEQKGTQAIRTTAAAFEVDTVLVIEDGFLSSFLRADLPTEVTIVRLPKSSGVVTRSPDQWTRQRDLRVCNYFHGSGLMRRLQPHHLVLQSSEVL